MHFEIYKLHYISDIVNIMMENVNSNCLGIIDNYNFWEGQTNRQTDIATIRLNWPWAN